MTSNGHKFPVVREELASCEVCGGGEAELTETCCGYRLSLEELDAIARGTLDYNGNWFLRSHATAKEEMAALAHLNAQLRRLSDAKAALCAADVKLVRATVKHAAARAEHDRALAFVRDAFEAVERFVK